MKRKDFIRNISLVGAGISLAPTSLFAAAQQSKIALPNTAVHIPHGNFADTNVERIPIQELGIEVSVQHFMRNGISATERDISVFTFRKENEVLNVCCNDDGWHISGELPGLRTIESKNGFSLKNDRFQLDLKAGSSYLSLRKV